MPNKMILVEDQDGHIFRVNPRDLNTFIEQHPGARRTDEATADEPEAKAVESPPENKARTMGTAGRK